VLIAAVECVSPGVARRVQALQTCLWHCLEKEYILAYLRAELERDPTYKASLLCDPINETAYYNDEEEECGRRAVNRQGFHRQCCGSRRDREPNQAFEAS
jgi:hypothetical protein